MTGTTTTNDKVHEIVTPQGTKSTTEHSEHITGADGQRGLLDHVVPHSHHDHEHIHEVKTEVKPAVVDTAAHVAPVLKTDGKPVVPAVVPDHKTADIKPTADLTHPDVAATKIDTTKIDTTKTDTTKTDIKTTAKDITEKVKDITGIGK